MVSSAQPDHQHAQAKAVKQRQGVAYRRRHVVLQQFKCRTGILQDRKGGQLYALGQRCGAGGENDQLRIPGLHLLLQIPERGLIHRPG